MKICVSLSASTGCSSNKMGSKAAVPAAAKAIFILVSVILFTSVSPYNFPCPPKDHSIPAIIPYKSARCPKDTLKFGVCGNWLGLVTEVIGTKPDEQCCSLVSGLADLEAAVCLCAAMKANVLGIVKLKVPVALSLLVNGCGKKIPEGFVC